MEPEDKRELEAKLPDHLASAARGLAGLVPFAGTALGEVLTQIVPNQRLDRIAKYLSILEARMNEAELEIQLISQSAEKVDLIEEGAVQATRATSDERIEHIARLVAQGLSTSDAWAIREKRLMKIFEQLDDEEVLLLKELSNFTHPNIPPDPSAAEARERLKETLPEALYILTPREMNQMAELKKAAIDTLLRLNLIREHEHPEPEEEVELADGSRIKLKVRLLLVTNLGWTLIHTLRLRHV